MFENEHDNNLSYIHLFSIMSSTAVVFFPCGCNGEVRKAVQKVFFEEKSRGG
jgi:hypothetical protein